MKKNLLLAAIVFVAVLIAPSFASAQADPLPRATTIITVSNPDGDRGPYLSGDIACAKNGYSNGCKIVLRAEVAKHSNGWDTFNIPCDYVFGDGRHSRPILEVECYTQPPPVINVSCLANPSSINTNQSTNFISSVSGGTGSYTYAWSGACAGSSANCSKTFTSSGAQTAAITVVSGSQTKSANCSVNVSQAVINHDHKACYNNNVYWYDSNNTISDIYQTCTGSQACTNGSCVNSCTSNYQQRCSGSNLYWYDSCGNQQNFIQYCPSGCSNNSCYSNPTLNISCFASPSSIQTGNSTTFISSVSGGTGSYNYSWSGSCNGSNSNCSNSFSNQGTYTSTVTVTSGSQTDSANCPVTVINSQNNNAYISCYNNDLYWFDQNGTRQSLYQSCAYNNNNNNGAPYCIGNNVYRQTNYFTGGCSGNACYNISNNNSVQLVQTCGNNQSCQNGACANINICECSSGPCCDGCHYKSSYITCNTDSQSEYGCPWGSVAGSDVGFRVKTRSQYCSGYSASCSGVFSNWTGLSSWGIAAYCNINQTCLSGNQTCQAIYTPAPTPTPSYFIHYLKGCYNNDLFWYDSLNVRQDKYRSCEDNNECTIDSCSGGKCNNELKCDGATCAKGSVNYCSSCNTCGDGVCNCGETLASCQKDCMGIIGLAINILGKIDSGSTQWTKTFAATANQEVDFLIVVSNGQDNTMDNIVIKADLPPEIIYDNGLTLDGNSYNGDIRTGISLGSLSPKTSRAISFKGKTAGNISRTEADTMATVSTSVGFSSDNVKTTFGYAPVSQTGINIKSGLAALLGINLSKPLYFLLWIVIIIFALFLISKIVQGFIRKKE